MLSSLWKKKTSLMVGIDIGSHSIKAVLLSQNDTGYVLETVAIEAMPRGAIVDREIQDIDAVGKVVAKIRKKISSSVSQAASAVSGQTVITKIIYMDVALNEQELASQIEIEADSLIPYPLDEVSLDFESLDINESDPSKINVLLSAARTESVEARVAALDAGGFDAKVIDVESYAISRAFDLTLRQLPDDAADKVVATVDLGATMTLFSVTEASKHIYSRDQLFGGEQYTRAIVSYYNKSFEDAELAKLTNDLPANYTFEVLAPFHTILVQQIRRAIQMFLTTSGQEKIDYLVISGGSALVEGIEQLLTEELAIHTVIANPFSGMEISTKIDQEQLVKTAPRLMVAAGLALRSFVPWHI
ncbi:pilus assembly protein PilM [Colwellia sp. M166]|uniref:pilus assembly protein PilM n=1 Tax=Colwellia sp. M166 TaxID=2583805 RepID=UPI00211ED2E4|nr:pilus assembly protein PilM [Colwellia sp. M166]UUO23957.1 pilus assembly protein PilM [Colwellia sp. M166]|tara:strand:- start:26129 stop:27208 length:1080 start_codon:yes stop_codon:yes gene_type:complete